MPLKSKKEKDLYGKVIGACYNQGGSKAKCKSRAERAIKSKRRKKK